LLIVFLAPYDKFYFIVVEGCLEIIYCGYILLQRPFESKFTNFRIFIMTLLFMGMEGVIGYYLYFSRKNLYLKNGEVALIYIIGITFLLGIIFCCLEHIMSWK